MSTEWSLPALLESFQDGVEGQLKMSRQAIGHPTEKGDASEAVWIEVFNEHLPKRYEARKAHVVDSTGQFSEQIDVVIHDRQYSPLVFRMKDSYVVPAESVYAVFEAKQEASADNVLYAQKKIASVRKLYRTSMPVPTVDGVREPKEPAPILGGMLTLASSWAPPLGDALREHLSNDKESGLIQLGCIANAGWFSFDSASDSFDLYEVNRPATRFLFELIARLQEMATVPMLDVRAYAAHIP
ncbi:hypothetical protein JVX96_21085 [Variovorax sp. PDNC026]|uniref:DUF6602 domain-containing protein n=1 Tax=Variovorax sp. PDNC026 TaxID=2811425 RepID=UPI0019636E90|nr:DUF6602 domain-containing protein [Variovorax sp. PDNC026]QRY30564.1 hypothetical protein JVX96_21085 [Variovorax sp. PDNC026]